MTPLARAAAAGVASALAYLAEQELDRRLMNPRSDDLLLLGGLVTSNPRLWRPLGLAMHLSAGAIFGMAYVQMAAHLLPGPPWWRGVAAAQIENALLFGLVPILNRFHPAVRRGALAPLTRPVYFVQQILRHLALGIVVGALCPPRPRPG
ncbi:MAG: hypothetical protein H0V51_04220 [Chloroflexi bacterium]|nr:hypothetical protein [Chloroflexota bacterium]